MSPDQKGPGPKETWWTSSSGERFSIVRYDENEYALASSDTFGTGDAEFWMPGLKLDDLARLIAIMQGVLDAKSAANTKGHGNRKTEWKRR